MIRSIPTLRGSPDERIPAGPLCLKIGLYGRDLLLVDVVRKYEHAAHQDANGRMPLHPGGGHTEDDCAKIGALEKGVRQVAP